MKLVQTSVFWALVVTHPAYGCDDDPAVSYLKMIEAMDWSAMETALHSDARYIDPTMTYFDRDAIDLSGASAIVDFWRQASEDSGTSTIDYTYRECFETAGFHIIHYDLTASVAGAFWNVDRETIELSGPITSVIRIRDGKVIEHQDYVDYASAMRQVEDLRRKYGAVGN